MDKKIFTVALILSASLFCSCNKDDDDENGVNANPYAYQKSDKKLVSATNLDDESYSIAYDGFGRVLDYVYKDEEYVMEQKNVYSDNSFAFDITKTKIQSGESSVTKGTGSLNEKGYVASLSQKSEDTRVEVKTMTYDGLGQLVSLEDRLQSEDGSEIETVNFAWTWENGDISKYETKIKDLLGNDLVIANEYIYTNDQVASPIENKGLLNVLNGYFDFDNETYRLLFGNASKNLPVEIKSDMKSTKFVWTLDSDGYPVKVDITESSTFLPDCTYSYNLTWE